MCDKVSVFIEDSGYFSTHMGFLEMEVDRVGEMVNMTEIVDKKNKRILVEQILIHSCSFDYTL